MRTLILTFILFCFLLSFNKGYSQKSCFCEDINYAKDEVSKKTYAIEELINRDLDSAKTLILCLDSCVKLKSNYENIIQTSLAHGVVLKAEGKYTHAIKMFEYALSLSEKKKFKNLEIISLYRCGQAYSLLENLPIALKYYLHAEELAASFGDLELLIEIYLNLGEFYRRSQQFDFAIHYLNKTKKLNSKEKLPLPLQIRMLNRYAAVWTEMDINHDSIVLYSQKALDLAISIGDFHSQALSYNELGARGDYFTFEERIEFYEKARNIWKELGYPRYEALAVINLVNSKCVPQNTYEEAIEMIKPLIPLLPDNSWEKDVLYKQLSGSYQALDNFEKALEVNEERFRTFSNVQAEAVKMQVESLTLKYEADKTQSELDYKSKELLVEKSQKRFYLLLISGLVFIVLLVIIFFWVIYLKNRKLNAQHEKINTKSEELKGLVAEKEVLLQEINHRVKNNMIMVSSILEMQQETTQNKEVKNGLQIGIDRVRSLMYANQQLYQTDSYTAINLNTYLGLIVENLLMDSEVEYELNLDKAYMFPIEKAQAIGFVINELITNSLKHAWKEEHPNKKISIHFTDGNTHLQGLYQDNGRGIDLEKVGAESTSLGMMLIQSFIGRQLNGEITFSNSDGAKIEFTCKMD